MSEYSDDSEGDASPKSGWDPEEIAKSLVMDKDVHNESNEQLTARLFKEAGPIAAVSIIHLAKHSPTERIRLDASKYVTERVLGRIEGMNNEEQAAPLAAFLDDVITYANAGGADNA